MELLAPNAALTLRTQTHAYRAYSLTFQLDLCLHSPSQLNTLRLKLLSSNLYLPHLGL